MSSKNDNTMCFSFKLEGTITLDRTDKSEDELYTLAEDILAWATVENPAVKGFSVSYIDTEEEDQFEDGSCVCPHHDKDEKEEEGSTQELPS